MVELSSHLVDLISRESQLTAETDEIREKVDSISNRLLDAQTDLTEGQNDYERGTTRYNLLNTVLAQLVQQVDSNECPLCGRRFESVDETLSVIRKNLESLPNDLTKQSEKLADRKRVVAALRGELDSLQQQAFGTDVSLKSLRAELDSAGKQIDAYAEECAAIGINLPLKLPSTWNELLDHADEDLSDIEVQSSLSKHEQRIASLSQELNLDIAKRDALSSKVASEVNVERRETNYLSQLQSEMTSKQFDVNALPTPEVIEAGLSSARVLTESVGNRLATCDSTISTIETAIRALRRKTYDNNEKLASMQAELTIHETTRNTFVSMCQSIGVDKSKPKVSIQTEQRVLKIRQGDLIQLEQDLKTLRREVTRLKSEIEFRELTEEQVRLSGQIADYSANEASQSKWVSSLERLEKDVVKQQVSVVGAHLESLEPTTQILYKRLNAHPIFSDVKIKVDERLRELVFEAETGFETIRGGKRRVTPNDFFSEAQLNALAIVIFLAGALRQRWSGFGTILIDDPIQQLDEMNIYAFIDLVRGLCGYRQFIILTCSLDFYMLASERLECLNSTKDGRFLGYRLEGIAPNRLEIHRDVG